MEDNITDREKAELLDTLAAKLRKLEEAMPNQATIAKTRMAIERLLNVARQDTGQSRIVADFLLAWWNAEECGGFDLADLWSLDLEISQDVILVFSTIARWPHYPDSDTVGLKKEFKALVKAWRPELGKAKSQG